MAALAVLCFCLTAQADGPVVTTDKPDYAPGETAYFTASGFQPLELVDFSVAVADDSGLWVPDIAWADISANSTGGANVDYVVPQTWAGKSLQLTVMGLTSGLMAQTTFTDAGPQPVHNVNFSTSGLPNGTAISPGISGNKINPPGNSAAYGPDSFTTPASSSPDEGTKPSTNLTFTGFPVTVAGVGEHWTLTSFTLGASGTQNGTLHDLDVSTGSGQYTTGADNSGAGKVKSTIVGNYTHFTDVVNNPPAITCLNPTAELGQKAGCLVNGTLQADFAVSYAAVPGSGNSKIVQATFTTPGGPVTVNVANVTDADAGDTISVSVANGTNPVTISGPGSGSASFSVEITANDGHAPDVKSTCSGTANAQIVYTFNGFFQPLDNNATTKVKKGSTVPVKFQVSDACGNQITTGNFSIDVSYLSGVVPAGDPEVTDAGASNDNGDFFRYDPTGQQWIYNLQTKVGYVVSDTYQISADLGDGVDHTASISIK
jgi:hypothetical protein